MKISTKGRYGLRIMLDLALNAGAKPRMIHQIADSQQISEKYISRLIIKLRKAGMVKSIRGAKGGYRIARYPKNLTLLEILEVMEGPVSIVNCVCHPKSCNVTEECAAREIWCNLNEEIRRSMAKITLQDIIEKYREKHEGSEYFAYCI